ncbi:MAG: hypothetical protein WC001_10905 [Desulfurivibrionaceae bacterium]
MKKHTYIQGICALIFLVGGCTLPAVHDPSLRTDKKTPTDTSSQPAEATAPVLLETKGKLLPKDHAAQPSKEKPPGKTVAPPAQEKQPPPPVPLPPAPPHPQVFTDYQTGLAFSYQHPWRLVSNKREGVILGRDGHFQLTARFATLTKDKDREEQIGYFYVPNNSLRGSIGKTLKSILGIEGQQTNSAPPLDVLLTQKHFPDLIIEKRYRGNNGGVIVQNCRHKRLPGQIQVYHIFIGDKVASFSLAGMKDRRLKLEMQQIVFSTRKP